MPRKLLKRFLPDPQTIRNRKELRFLGRLLDDPYLLHLNRRSVAGAAASGLFVAFLPTPGQMLIAAALAIMVRANLPLAVMTVWITNPITMPPIFYSCYRLGLWLLGRPVPGAGFQPSLEWFWEQLNSIWQPFLLGCFVVGTIAAVTAFLAVHLLWRLHVVRAHKRRRARRLERDPR